MPRLPLKLPGFAFALSGAVCLALCAGCPKSDQTAAGTSGGLPPATSAEPAPGATDQEVPSGPPPERYATLPPGALDGKSDGTTGTGDGNAAGQAAAPADPGLVPNAGSFDLTGVRVGMNAAEVYGRYPPDSGWAYDKRFAGESETGVVMAKPRDSRARASELFYLLDGSVVAFLRAVQEDDGAYKLTAQDLARQFGSGEAAPPQWSRGCSLLRGWHSSANEQAQFWGDPRKRQVLTAGHSPTGSETVYMLFDIDMVDQVQQAMARAGEEVQPEPDRSWSPPPHTRHPARRWPVMRTWLPRATLPMLLCCLACGLLPGCPAAPGKAPSRPPAAQAPDHAAPDSGMTVSAPPKQQQPAEAPADPNAKPGDPKPRVLQLELAGLRLGGSYDEVDKFIHSDGQPRIQGQWVDHKGGTGTVAVRPSKGGQLPADDYFFFASKCAGYFKRFKMSDEDYVHLVEAMAGNYDPGTGEPPAWAADDPIAKALPKLSGRGGRVFWGDEARGELLVIQREDPSGNGFCALYHPADTTAIGIEYSDFTGVFAPEKPSKAVVK